VVDPIDGTANFARGLPHYCVSIALVADGLIEAGVIYDPALDDLFAARRGAGATLNGARLTAADTTNLAAASIEVGWNMRSGVERFVALAGRVAATGAGVRRSGSGALGLAYVAAGRTDGYVEHHINSWDCLAGILLITEAGGYASDFLAGDGLRKGNALLACAPGVRDALVKLAAIQELS
jgi:myo-inositol-1(or 4)-monophosphatase